MIYMANKDYEVGLAVSQQEREEVYHLRYQIFNKELNEGNPDSHKNQMDKDQYDDYCDHIIVRHIETGKIIGTYRIMLRSKTKVGFYSETEFDCGPIYQLTDEVAEIGRTCILKGHRGGEVLNLLWYGLDTFTHRNKARYLFGMTSVHTNNEESINQAWAYLKTKKVFDDKIWITPINPPSLNKATPDRSAVPKLLTRYFKVGAKIIGEPNFDDIFGCYDIPTIIDLQSFNFLMVLVKLQARSKIAFYNKITRRLNGKEYDVDGIRQPSY